MCLCPRWLIDRRCLIGDAGKQISPGVLMFVWLIRFVIYLCFSFEKHKTSLTYLRNRNVFLFSVFFY